MTAVRGLRMKKGRSYSELERIASRVRSKLIPDVDVDQPLPILRIFEGLGKFTIANKRVRYVVEEELGFDVEALTRYTRDADAFDVVLNKAMYELVELNVPGRPFFTLPHEIGHLVLHTDELIQLATIPHHRALLRGGGEHAHCFDSEWQANSLGAAVAMPAAGLTRLEARGLLTPEVVQATYSVSAQAASVRVDVFTRRKAELVSPTRHL